MVFGLFTRKSTLDTPAPADNDQHTLPTPTPSITSATHSSPFRLPAVLGSAALGSSSNKDSDQVTDSFTEGTSNGHLSPLPPPATPSPPLLSEPNDTKILYDLMLTVPPKTLHAYTLTRLQPPTPLPSASVSSPALGLFPDDTLRPPSPGTVTKLTAFFSRLAPPPLLHCMRCHKDFYNIENEEKDKACRVAHDDESTLVSRVSGASGGGYETLWGCCGQTVSGDGGEGPPDGWCYEGRHTTDVKRARFRADSTIHNDKLISCFIYNCHGIRQAMRAQQPQHDLHASASRIIGTSSARKSNPSPARSQASTLISRSARKRPRRSLKESSSENEADSESLDTRAIKAKDKEKVGGKKDECTDREPSTATAKPKSQPARRGRPRLSSPTRGVHLTSGSSLTPMGSAKAKATPTKLKSTSHVLLSQSHTHIASDSDASTRSRPRTRSHVRDESRGRAGSKLARADIAERAGRAKKASRLLSRSTMSEDEGGAEADEYRESDQEERGRDRKKRRLRS